MMPFPLTFLVEKNCACPTYQNRSLDHRKVNLSLHYAIKGPENPSSETILQTFDHVTKETIFFALLIFLKPQGLKPVRF
jgi:hypothetical protein